MLDTIGIDLSKVAFPVKPPDVTVPEFPPIPEMPKAPEFSAAPDAAQVLQATKQRDIELWHDWNTGGRKKADMEPLFRSFRPMIRKFANQWSNSADLDLPPRAIHAEFSKHFVDAMHTYDPSKGHLGSWVGFKLRKAKRWIANYRHPARMVEARFYKVGKFDNAKTFLYDQLEREPSSQEVADHLGWSISEVARMEAEKRKSLSLSGWDYDPLTIHPSKEMEAFRNVMHELTDEEKVVAEHTWGLHGKEELKPTQIAQKTGWSPSKITRLRISVSDKIGRYLK